MDVPLWQALTGGIAALLGGSGLARLLGVRPANRKADAESAQVLAKAYSILVDDLRKDIARQDKEISELRSELRTVVETRHTELAAVRTELAAERAENGRLRHRVQTLEGKVHTLTQRPDNSDAT